VNNGRYVVDENGKRVGVLLDIEEYEDIRVYDEAVAELEPGEDELIPFDQAVREIEGGRVLKDDS
jgi:hypothetical protein